MEKRLAAAKREAKAILPVYTLNNSGVKTGVKKTKKAEIVLKYFLAILGLFAVSLFDLNGITLGVGAFVALIFCGLNPFVMSVCFLGFSFFPTFNAAELIFCGVAAVVAPLGKYLIKHNLKKENAAIAITAVLCHSGIIGNFFFYNGLNALSIFLTFVFSTGFFYAAFFALKPIFLSGLKYKLLEAEMVALGLIVGVASYGLANLAVPYFSPLTFFAGFFILSALAVGGKGAGLAVAAVIGAGASAGHGDISFIAIFSFAALIGGIFNKCNRIIYLFAISMAYAVFIYFFSLTGAGVPVDLLSFFFGGLIFSFLPYSLIDGVRNFLFTPHSKVAVRYLLNRNKEEFYRATEKSAGVFSDMADMMTCISVNKKEEQNITERKICTVCPDKKECRVRAAAREMLDRLVVHRASVGICDIPEEFVKDCAHLSKLMAGVNSIAHSRENERNEKRAELETKRIVGEHLKEVSEITERLGKNVAVESRYDFEAEQRIAYELNYEGIPTSEVLVGERVVAILRTDCYKKELVERAISRVLKCDYKVCECDATVIAGYSIVSLSEPPILDVVFSFAVQPKIAGDVSGDVPSVVKIDDTRLLIALCDGMGSGMDASESSTRAVSLVESFYSAGFSSDFVLSKVNRFLTTNSGGSFSALDICVLDLKKGFLDIIKFAAPPCYIKRKDTVERILGSSLPFGTLCEARPFVDRKRLCGGEMIILCSDGVSDSFVSDELSLFINNIDTFIPDSVVQKIIEEAKRRNKGVYIDDTSVLCARVFKR